MEKKLKVLLLEDVQDDIGLIVRALSKGGMQFDHKCVDSREEFTSAIRTYHPDVILSDHSLPQFNSLEALKIRRRLKLLVPFILVTGAVSEEFAVTCLQQGADDYVLKSNLTRLPSAIQNAIKQQQLDEQRRTAERELRLQNEALTKVNMEMDSFVYSVSHNIRAPLMSVLGLLNLAKREDQERGNYFDQYFKMMAHSIQKLDETLKDILEYSRNARNEITFEAVNMRNALDDIFERLKYIDGFEKININISFLGSDLLYSDEYRIVTILNNLISNAIKYRDEKKEMCLLKISLLIQEKVAIITIEDNGIGIPEELLPKIFDMFFRATIKSEGAGLGLYIAKETIHKLMGTITVDSEYGRGTKFTVKIPNHLATAKQTSTGETNF
ncbi:MAG TPA: hybrid sensor histidine kinase/response regulator [Cyclobacteriaceae bacterium]|nr:hybrid sensor histidine kinase/response regulator [Cyclobacteriaceae bacterium]